MHDVFILLWAASIALPRCCRKGLCMVILSAVDGSLTSEKIPRCAQDDTRAIGVE
jgi:hypothetical protein